MYTEKGNTTQARLAYQSLVYTPRMKRVEQREYVRKNITKEVQKAQCNIVTDLSWVHIASG